MILNPNQIKFPNLDLLAMSSLPNSVALVVAPVADLAAKEDVKEPKVDWAADVGINLSKTVAAVQILAEEAEEYLESASNFSDEENTYDDSAIDLARQKIASILNAIDKCMDVSFATAGRERPSKIRKREENEEKAKTKRQKTV